MDLVGRGEAVGATIRDYQPMQPEDLAAFRALAMYVEALRQAGPIQLEENPQHH
jgi:hypothetical protein